MKAGFSIDIEVDEKLTKYCNKQFINKSKLVNEIIKVYLNNETKK